MDFTIVHIGFLCNVPFVKNMCFSSLSMERREPIGFNTYFREE